jgi:hypothetical protein
MKGSGLFIISGGHHPGLVEFLLFQTCLGLKAQEFYKTVLERARFVLKNIKKHGYSVEGGKNHEN